MRKTKPTPEAKSGSTSKTPRKGAEHERVPPALRANSKQAQVLDLLRQPQGATIPIIMNATGWQSHSVRGFFAGVLRKKLGLTVESEKPESGDRIYRIGIARRSKSKHPSKKLNRHVA